jgi:hypothetical protein
VPGINNFILLGAVAHIYNPSYQGDGDWEDKGSSTTQTRKKVRETPISII